MRCELFDVEVERLTFFSTFTQRSLEEVTQVEIEPAAELGTRAPRAGRDRRRGDRGRRAPGRRRAAARGPLPRSAGPAARRTALVAVAAEEELEPALRDLWEDVTTSFHDADAHHLYVLPERLTRRARRAARRCCCRASPATSRTSSAPRPPTPRRARCGTPSPSWRSSSRSGYRTVVAWARRGEAERAAYNLDRIKAAFLDGRPRAARAGPDFAAAAPARGLPVARS